MVPGAVNPSISPDTLGQLSPGPLFASHPWPVIYSPSFSLSPRLPSPSSFSFFLSSLTVLRFVLLCLSRSFRYLLLHFSQSNVCRFLDPFVKMKFNSAIALSSLLALAVAQDSSSTTSAATTTASLSPQASCATKCKFLSTLLLLLPISVRHPELSSSIPSACPNHLCLLHSIHRPQQTIRP